MMNETLIQINFFAQLISTGIMTGLIWFVQIVHYPLFSFVGNSHFVEYERNHTIKTTRIVAPPMLIESITSIGLIAFPLGYIPAWQPIVGFVLLLVIWVSTACLQVPCHRRLEHNFDSDVHRRLVNTNWIRTIAWSARFLLVIWMTKDFMMH